MDVRCACGCGEFFVPFDDRGRPRKFIYGHWARTQQRSDPIVRFMERVIPEPNSGCWLWTGQKAPGGYGMFWPGGHNGTEGKRVGAHRWVYEQFVGTIPEGLLVLHRCDTPPCVNPAHLWIGTQKDNMADCYAKGRRWHQLQVPA